MTYNKIDQQWIFKIVIFGESNVGKTTLTKKFVKNEFYENIKKTIGVDFEIKKLDFPNEVSITLQLWDFSGEKQFEVLFPYYLNGTDGGLFLFDITMPNSFEAIDKWLNIVYKIFQKKKPIVRYLFKQENIDIPLIIIGTKYDLYENNFSQEEKIKIQNTIDLAKQQTKLRGFDFKLISSKTGMNVEQIFRELTEKIKAIRQIKANMEKEKQKILSKLFE